MSQRLYYTDSMLCEFDAHVAAVENASGRTAVILDRSAFYPSSGGQPFDTGWLELGPAQAAVRARVKEVIEDEASGRVLHLLETVPAGLEPGAAVHGAVDRERRLDHMQQHSGQHVLSAAFVRLFGFETVSFHMGDESCTIDLAASALSAAQVREAESLANRVIAEDRPVSIHFVSADEARGMGVRKIPPAERDRLRLIDIRDFDLNACGGTHVSSTGQIGGMLLRKTENVRQGVRAEFVCGLRAVRIARRDFETLTEAAAVFSTHIWEVPAQARKSLDEVKAAQKAQHRLLEEVADLLAADLLRQTAPRADSSRRVTQFFADRDLAFIKMLAQKLTKSAGVAALLGCGGTQPSLVFAQSAGLGNDMGALMKQAVQAMGTRGGGNRDMAQGGAPDAPAAERALASASEKIG